MATWYTLKTGMLVEDGDSNFVGLFNEDEWNLLFKSGAKDVELFL